MLLRLRLPKTLMWVFSLLIIYFLLFTLFRMVTFIAFRPSGAALGEHIGAFFLGLRFDLRWISFILLPIVLAGLTPRLSPFYSSRTKLFWTWYLALATLFLLFFFAADFGCFAYNKTRLNASALNFAEDPVISIQMLWQSYPLLWMLLGLFAAVVLLRLLFRHLHQLVVLRTEGRGIRYQRKWFLGFAFLLGLLAYGSPALYPLTWNAAFRFNDSFKSYLALNPLQNFFTTLKLRRPHLEPEGARVHFSLMKELLSLPEKTEGYMRMVAPRPSPFRGRPNVVLVVCESFSMYKSSMSGNRLNTTPYFKSLTDSGLFFNRCFTPHFSTARGLFATLTGTPDVQLSKFSTRNPEALDQHVIINDFKDYSRFYFLGGSAAFNNFEGLVRNIEGVSLFTEGRFRSQPHTVWGISDKDLFAEANAVLRQQQAPFFAIIQTADNHRPFTLPENDPGFKEEVLPPEVLKENGFESIEEYNALRYFDHSVAQFMEAARKEAYFSNTLFVFVGDHGVSGNAQAVYPKIWTEQRLTEEHVPLLFYAPGKIPAALRTDVVSQIDVLPSIAGLTGQRYRNTTLGRDVSLAPQPHPLAFTIAHDEGRIGLITDKFYFTRHLNFRQESLHFFDSTSYSPRQQDSIRQFYSRAALAYYETARYLLVNNKKKGVEP
jgi:phosphoglycerol transferase MdoB-like AlkP superfamily enzyme